MPAAGCSVSGRIGQLQSPSSFHSKKPMRAQASSGMAAGGGSTVDFRSGSTSTPTG